MNKCEKCGFLHYRTDPCRVAKKSTERKNMAVADAVAPDARVNPPALIGGANQAVDPPKRGRPIMDNPKSPRAEYQRILMRKRRLMAKTDDKL